MQDNFDLAYGPGWNTEKPVPISLVPRALSYMAFTLLQVAWVEAAKALKGRVVMVSRSS